MLNPAIGKLINSCENRYKLVNEIAKEARQISSDAEQKGEILIEKPVSIAIDKLVKEV
ncbi:MAG: DNA-directed RNA polymerase subunit omega [Clostridia bacterium]|nr:DNA-directed RNA polymerase subunit omega [Clostridia bacterium]MBR6743360.1 DNA-directed RNA polymerase subunit omega [Clostridia bacterium]